MWKKWHHMRWHELSTAHYDLHFILFCNKGHKLFRFLAYFFTLDETFPLSAHNDVDPSKWEKNATKTEIKKT